MTGRRPAPALLGILRGEGVDRVFGDPGTAEPPFLAALADDGEDGQAPEYVLGVHEDAVVPMADGYARATGRPAFVSPHTRPASPAGSSACSTPAAPAPSWW